MTVRDFFRVLFFEPSFKNAELRIYEHSNDYDEDEEDDIPPETNLIFCIKYAENISSQMYSDFLDNIIDRIVIGEGHISLLLK